MTLIEAFHTYLVDQGVATDEDLFIGRIPDSNHVDAGWWLKSYGGTPVTRAVSGEMLKTYQIQVFYRDRNPATVEGKLFALEELLNGRVPAALPGFTTYESQAFTFPIDNDLDDEERKVGLLQANIMIYKE